MISLRPAQQRGKANFGWLNSQHTFSFGDYYDPQHMGFSALRVINDDLVTPGAGFSTHGHRDMEIISYVQSGSIAHKDSEGNIKVLSAGEFQLMSAGSGITHSEYNASQTEPLKFLQIWIQPNTLGGTPGYQQKNFGQAEGLTTIASPYREKGSENRGEKGGEKRGERGGFELKQDATLSQLILAPKSEQVYQIEAGRNIYVHHVAGQLSIEDNLLTAGDGAKITEMQAITFVNASDSQATALIFNLP
ncbi:pirin domain protein [Shewanella sediminis HAW-EB3]|uniref:Pirin domain protein n=1 Tax=Shewanella sediminis (strain HAW-EB3) TaxID=425104 RepID=A8FWE8_SHESH|nr:pirin family protein [Shewanella sediminis]ABV37171.1 pirin domain protein [Shewanella sediminis HAW-EB3]